MQNTDERFPAMRIIHPMIFLLATTVLVGCQGESVTESNGGDAQAKSTNAVPETPADPKSKALAAKDALFGELSTRQVQVMSNGGPVAAIEVCSKDAQRLAAEVSKEHGVKIGRTSFKLRNPQNAPPEWAKTMIEERISKPQFVDLADGMTGALLPIKLKPQCMTCHGPTDQIDEKVQVALAELYPDDQATGFKVDDLRGWFWVEIP